MNLHYSYLLLAGLINLPSTLAASSNLRRLPKNGNGKGEGKGKGQGPNGGLGGGKGGGRDDEPEDGLKTYIVTFKNKNDTPSRRCEAMSKGQGGSTKKVYNKVLNGCAMRVTSSALAAFRNDPNVERVEENMMAFASQDFGDATWGLDRVNQCNLPLDGTGTRMDANGVKVYILDTGIRGDHVDFAGSIDSDSTCHVDLMGEGDALNDGNGHGTHVASTTCGNAYGVAKNCELCAVKVLGATGGGSLQGILDGLDHVVSQCENGAARCVVNMSLGFNGISASADAAVKTAVEAGVTVVVAAGNSNTNACNVSPARAPKAITVGSTTSVDARSSFSNYGECLDVYAPGSSITAAWRTSSTATNTISGTSMASPHVAGIAAGILGQAASALTPAQVLDVITSGSNDPGISDSRSPGVPLATTTTCLSAPTPSPAPTPACVNPNIEVEINTDNYPGETSWTLENECTGQQVGSGGSYGPGSHTEEMCGFGEFTFTISDTFGDGICCSVGSGSYKITYNGAEVAAGGDFGSSETKTFGSCGGTNPPIVSPTPPPSSPPVTMSPVTNPPVAPTNPPVAPTNPPVTASPVAPIVTPPPTTSPTSQATSQCKLVQVQVTDSNGVVHTLGPITISEDSEVEALSFNVEEQGMATCPGTDSDSGMGNLFSE